MKKFLKILAYMGIVGGTTALGSIFGSGIGGVTFLLSFLIATPIFVITDAKDRTIRFDANLKDDENYDMEEILGEYKGTYLSNTKTANNEKVLANHTLDKNDTVGKVNTKADEAKKYFHSKFTPSSQDVKSRKPIEDDFELTM